MNACYLLYDRPSNTLSIANSQGNGILQSVTPGGGGTLTGSECSVAASTASVSVSGNTVSITLTINFNASFAGAQNIYAAIVDTSYNESSFQQIGTWTVDNVSVSPSAGSGSPQTFAFSYASAGQMQEHFYFNSSATGANACYLLYDRHRTH